MTAGVARWLAGRGRRYLSCQHRWLRLDVYQGPFPCLKSLASLKQVWDLVNNRTQGRPSLISLQGEG